MVVSRTQQSPYALKAIDGQEGRVGGYLAAYGTEAEKDFQGEWFDPDTDFRLDIYEGRFPAFYHHGLNQKIKSIKVGSINFVAEPDEIGIWAEAELNLSNKYIQAIHKLALEGKLFWSSGAIPHLVQVEENGRIKTWPIFEGSLTPTPANPRHTNIQQLKSVFSFQGLKAIGLDGLDEYAEEHGLDWADIIGELPEIGQKAEEAVADPPAETEAPPAASSDEPGETPEEQETPDDTPKSESESPEDKPAANTPQSQEVDATEDEPAPKKDESEAPESTPSPQGGAKPQKDSPSSGAVSPTESSDQPKSNDKEGFTMEEHMKSLISTVADGLKVSLSEDGQDNVWKKMYADTKEDVHAAFGKETEVDIGHMKFKLRDSSYRKALANYIRDEEKDKEPEKGEGEDEALKSLADEIIAGNKRDGETDKDTDDQDGKGGTLKHQQYDGVREGPHFIQDMNLKSLYDQLDWMDMSYLYDMRMKACLDPQRRRTFHVPNFFGNMLYDKFHKVSDNWAEWLNYEDDNYEPGKDAPLALKAMYRIGQDMHRHGGMKANELEHTSNTGFGAEWIATLWQAELWRLMLNNTMIASQFRTFDMPSDPFTIPLEGDVLTVESATETTDSANFTLLGPVTQSNIPTDNMTITAQKLGINSKLSKEITEDAIISMLPYNRERQMLSMMRTMDRVLMNADATTGNTNINTIGSTPTSKSDFLLGFKGLAKIAHDNGALKDAGGGNPGLLAFRDLHDNLDDEFLNMNSDLFYAVTPKVFTRLKSMDKFLESEVQSGRVTGQFGNIDGVPVISSHLFGDANAEGKKSATAGNNTTGRAMVVFRPQFLIGYRRRIDTWMQYVGASDAFHLGMWVRFTFDKRDDDRDAVVLMHNIGVGSAA